MRRASTLAAAAVAALCGAGLAHAASAQEAAARRPNTVIPHGGQASAPRAGLTQAPGPVRRTLTPANAWMQPAPAVVPAAQPAPQPVAAAPAPQPQPVRAQPQSQPAVDYLPNQGRGQPAPVEAVYAPPPAAAPVSGPAPADRAADPMAPRRDAPIFRMQQGATPQPMPAQVAADAAPQAAATSADQPPRPIRVATVVNTGEQPPQQGARYYSVHRQNGRQPDALVMPTPTYVDALAVTMTETPASQDLAQPDQGPTLIRDGQGRVRAAPAASDGDHQ